MRIGGGAGGGPIFGVGFFSPDCGSRLAWRPAMDVAGCVRPVAAWAVCRSRCGVCLGAVFRRPRSPVWGLQVCWTTHLGVGRRLCEAGRSVSVAHPRPRGELGVAPATALCTTERQQDTCRSVAPQGRAASSLGVGSRRPWLQAHGLHPCRENRENRGSRRESRCKTRENRENRKLSRLRSIQILTF